MQGLALFLAFTAAARAQTVDSGSTGSLGALVVTNDTFVQLPPDGKLNYTTVTVEAGATLRFGKNPLNTPVYLLATSDVVIRGVIDVSGSYGGNNLGQGGPGGFNGGAPGISSDPGDGEGPGGGQGGVWGTDKYPGNGSHGSTGVRSLGPKYGNRELQPLIGGSGGGGQGSSGGSGGGGAILIASNTKIEVSGGGIWAIGGQSFDWAGNRGGGGAGGAVRLVAPAIGGAGGSSEVNCSGALHAGTGRIRIDGTYLGGISFNGLAQVGQNFVVIPAAQPALRFIEAAGQAIPVDAGNTIRLNLSRTASTNQTVKLRLAGFTGFVPVTVAVLPEEAASSRVVTEINMAGNATAETTVNVTLTPGMVNRIQAWTQ
jgi:hypothetical protein